MHMDVYISPYTYIYTCIYNVCTIMLTCIYLYIYIYLETERNIYRENGRDYIKQAGIMQYEPARTNKTQTTSVITHEYRRTLSQHFIVAVNHGTATTLHFGNEHLATASSNHTGKLFEMPYKPYGYMATRYRNHSCNNILCQSNQKPSKSLAAVNG
jgi:hypothetical protein